jgi:hypothetical protein
MLHQYDQYEDFMSYNDLLSSLKEDGENIVWKFKCISAHQGALMPKDKDWNGSVYNVIMEWENGEITAQPLSIIAADDPVSCAIYARDDNLLDVDGWKQFRGIAKHQQKLHCMVNQDKLRSFPLHPDSSTDTRSREILDMPSGSMTSVAKLNGWMPPLLS